MKDKNKKDPDVSANGQDGNEMGADNGEETMTEKACKKSMDLSGEDLEKSLGRLGEFAQSNDAETRKNALLQKAMEGELEKSERDELFGLMGGSSFEGGGDSHAETITKSMDDNDTLQKALDVSDYLREQHEELCKSLGQLAEYQEQAESRQHEFNLILAKAVSDTGTLVKAMSERLGVIAAQPARAPKSRGVPQSQPLQKSFAGQAPDGEQLSKSMVLDTLDSMHVESMEKGMDGRTPAGESILNAIAKYENTNMLSKSMLAEVKAHRQRQATAH